MPVNQVAIIYPVFVQVLLTLTVYCLLLAARARALRTMDRKRGSPDLAMGTLAWPDEAAKRANNQRNQFELPMLFYAVVAFALITKGADLAMIVLAWAFVLSRLVHAAIHIGPNKVRWRSPAFGLGLLIVAAMWLDADKPMSPTALLIMFGLIGASLLFMFSISRRGARRILRPRRSMSEAHQVLAIWHENDEAISFLRRIEEVPIEAFPKGSLFRSSNTAAIGWGMLVVLIMGVGIPLAYFLNFDLFGLVSGEERPTDTSNSVAATMIMLIFAPVVFVLTYIVYRFLVGGAAELGARAPLNGFVSGVLRGIAMGRDGDQVICNVSTDSHTHGTQSVKLEGECATRMQAAAGAAADKLIDKYRWSLFTVGADTNAPLTNLATDAMTWDSLIHTTYFDQPEVAELIAAHIVGKARGGP